MSSAAGQALDYSRANSYLKEIYAPKIEDMAPEADRISKDVPFVTADKVLGRFYHQPVKLTRSMGVTWNNDGSAFALNYGLAPAAQDAQVQGAEIVDRDTMSYAMMQRALSGGGGTAGKKAFVSATQDTMVNLTKSASFFREVALLYGGGPGADANLGTVESVTTATGTSLVVVITAATWATALWAGCENGEYDLYNGSTKINTNGTAAARDNNFVLASVTPSTRSVGFTSNASNVTAANASAGYVWFFAGARTKDMVGIQAACSISGTLWNVSTSTYFLWKPTTQAVGGQLSFEKVMQGISKVADIGFSGSLKLYCSNQGFQDLVNDQTALVRHADEKNGDVGMGYKSVTFYTQCGPVKIVPHRLVKNGVAFALPDGGCMRVGSTDITFEMPGYGKMIRELENTAGAEVRTYTDQAFFCKHPAFMIYFTGITNSV